MDGYIRFTLLLGLLGFAGTANAQSHYSNWLHRNAQDTTIVPCRNDSLTRLQVPPGSLGMMHPDSMFCRIEIMPLDSLHSPHDSAYIGWCRFTLGEDSLHDGYMNYDSTHGSNHHQMQFMGELNCRIYWDSLKCDSLYRSWRPVEIRGWTGAGWVTLPSVTFDGNTAAFSTNRLYSAFAFIGEPTPLTGVVDENRSPAAFGLFQNYPNPFNPVTTIGYILPVQAHVTLKIYDISGREVATLVNGMEAPGPKTVKFDALNLATGTYLYRLQAGEFSETRHLVVIR